MPGLTDTTGLSFGTGLAWLSGGLGGPIGLDLQAFTPLTAGGVPSTIDFNFAGGNIWNGSSLVPASSILTCARTTGGYALTAEGTLTWFSANTLRITDLGLLVEEARTNVLLRSQQFTPSPWITSQANTTDNVAIAPDGSQTAAELIANTASNQVHGIVSVGGINVTTSTSYVFSVYLRLVGTFAPYIMVDPTNSGAQTCVFDLINGVVLTSLTQGGSIGAITPMANGWYRCAVTFVATSNSNVNPAFYPCATANNNRNYTSDGLSGIQMWGAQFETGGFPSTYIPTLTTSVARGYDNVSMPVSAIPNFSATKGSMYASIATLGATNNFRYICLTDDAGSFIALRGDSNNAVSLTVAGGVSNSVSDFVAQTGGESGQVGGVQWAGAWALNDMAYAENGNPTQTAASNSVPSVVNLRLSGFVPNSGSFNTYIKRVAYWSQRLPNASIQSVSLQNDWLLSAGGNSTTLDLDFINKRAWSGNLTTGATTIDTLVSNSNAVGGSYINAEGVLQTFGANVIRYGTAGLLVEESRTNLLLQSNTFGTTWTSTNLTNLTTTTTGPDAVAASATLLNETVTNGNHGVNQTVTKAASALAYALTVFAKQGPGRTRITIKVDDGAGTNGATATYDLAGGNVVAPVGTGVAFTSLGSTITTLASGWYQLAFTFTTNTTASLAVHLFDDNGSGTAAASFSYAGVVSDGVFIYGAQVEQATFPTTYIATTTATVTRPADVTRLISSLPAFANPAAPIGAFVASYIDPFGTITPGGSRILGTGAGPDYGESNTSTNIGVFDGTPANANLGYGTVSTGALFAHGFDQSSISIMANAGQLTSAVVAAASYTPQFQFLGSGGGNQFGSRFLKRVSFFGTRPTDATLLPLTNIPPWVNRAGGNTPQLDLDFVGNRGWAAPLTASNPNQTLASLLTCTRAQSVNSYYTTAVGTLIPFAANTLRVGDQGLLVEESRTNIVLQSQFASGWTKQDASDTLTANAVAAPDGTTTAATLLQSATTGNHAIAGNTSGTYTSGQSYTLSCYGKYVAGTSAVLQLYTQFITSGTAGGSFDLLAGTALSVSGTGNASASIQALANGWFRCVVTFVAQHTDVNAGVFLGVTNNINDPLLPNQAGDGVRTIAIWGYQSEAATFPTSYISTGAAPVARNADNITYSASLSIFTPAQGTFFGDVAAMPTGSSGGAIVADTTTHTFLLGGGPGLDWETADQNVNYTAASGASIYVPSKVAASYQGNVHSISVNGSAPVTATAANAVVQYVSLSIGNNTGSYLNTYLKRLTFWNTKFNPQ